MGLFGRTVRCKSDSSSLLGRVVHTHAEAEEKKKMAKTAAVEECMVAAGFELPRLILSACAVWLFIV